MKALKKPIFCLVMIFALVLGFSSICFANESEDFVDTEASVADNEALFGSELTESPTPDSDGGYANNSVNTERAVDTNSADEGENPFSIFFETISSYSAEVLSALAFVGSLILAFCYKKGLIPLVESALSAIAKAVGGIREKAEVTESVSRELCENLTKRLEAAEGVLAELGTAITTTTATLDTYEKTSGERASMKLVLEAQIDMLYDIFMTSSLPQYQKDTVGERISKMKEALSVYESEAV